MRRTSLVFLLLLGLAASAEATETSLPRERRQRAATAFPDGILLFHASVALDIHADGFHQDAFFYYFTGLENTIGAVLAIDGKANQSWLFLPSQPPYSKLGLKPEVQPGPEAEQRLGIDHVSDWSQMEQFFASRAGQAAPLYYTDDLSKFVELPPNLASPKSPKAPAWLQVILQKWATFEAREVTDKVSGLMEVQAPEEIADVRLAAKATVKALMAGMHAIRPGVSQSGIESVVENTCWSTGAHGTSFWPWAMSGENGVFPRPFMSTARYDHLNQNMQPGDLVRLDVGCEYDHYEGDLGRTVPVSGHYDEAQRETWSIFVAAYQAGVKSLREGVTVDQVFTAWQEELVSHRASAKTLLAQHAINSWSDRKNIPYWQIHTSNLSAAYPVGALRAGTTINFEPIASVDNQGFFLEDMYLITKDGAELLTPGVPYSAEAIEAAMK